MDPAVVDRRTTLLAGIDAASLPRRRMSISGMEGSLDAVILSKDMSGPTTRLVSFPVGWGSGVPGAFTAGVEIFVLEGELMLAGDTLGARDYAVIPATGVFGGIRAMTSGRALLMTEAPVRYDTASGGAPADLHTASSGEMAWLPQPGHEGRFMKELQGDGRTSWLSGSLEWEHRGSWHRHDAAEECFVIEGELRLVEWIDGEPVPHTYGPGGYVWRPPHSIHAGPGSEAADRGRSVLSLSGKLDRNEVARGASALDPDEGTSSSNSATPSHVSTPRKAPARRGRRTRRR